MYYYCCMTTEMGNNNSNILSNKNLRELITPGYIWVLGVAEIELGEAAARIILAIGALQEHGIEPSYADLVRITGKSPSRVRTIVSELASRHPSLVAKKRGKIVWLSLTEEGWRVYRELKRAILGSEDRLVEPSMLIKMFDELLYSRAGDKSATLGRITVTFDSAASAANISIVARRLRDAVGATRLFGMAMELAGAAEAAAGSGVGDVSLKELVQQGINAVLRVARAGDIALPPHVLGRPVSLEDAVKTLRPLALWPADVSRRIARGYADEADAMGLLRVIKGRGWSGIYLQPRLESAAAVVGKVLKQGFEVLVTSAARSWMPAIVLYADVAEELPTAEQVVNGETRLLKIVKETMNPVRLWRWVEHLLGLRLALKIPALASGATFDTLGVIHLVEVDGEVRLVPLTAGRRLLLRGLPEIPVVGEVYPAVRRRAERLVEETGFYGLLIRDLAVKGFAGREEALRAAKRYGSNNPERDVRELAGLGFIYPTAEGCYSAWTVAPLRSPEEEAYRTLQAWLARELRLLGREEVYEDIVKPLAKRGEASIASLQASLAVKAAKLLEEMERMGVAKIEGDTLKAPSREAQWMLAKAYIEWKLSRELTCTEPLEPRERPNLKEVLIRLSAGM
jgi:hypothetical protein